MKIKLNYILALLLAGVILLGANLASEPSNKIGHLDSSVLLEMMPEVDTIRMKLENVEKENTKQLELMYAEYQQKMADVQNMSPDLPESIQKNKYQEVVDLEKRIKNFQTESTKDYDRARVKLLNPVLDKIGDAIDAVAAEDDFDYILDTSYGTVLYHKDSHDVMELVKKKLNITAPTPKNTDGTETLQR